MYALSHIVTRIYAKISNLSITSILQGIGNLVRHNTRRAKH